MSTCGVSLDLVQADSGADEAIVAWTKAQGGPSARARHVDDRGLFSISYPSTWLADGPGELGDYLELVWSYPARDEPVRLIVMLLKKTGEMKPLDEFVQWYQEKVRARGVPLGAIAVTPLTISGHPARRVRYLTKARTGDLVIQAYNFFVIRGRYLMSLTYAAPTEKAADYEPLFDDMMRGFHLEDRVLDTLFGK